MFKPSLRSLSSLIILGVTALVLYIVVFYTRVDVPDKPQKEAAAQLMQNCLADLKGYAASKGFPTEVEDINNTALIGPKESDLVTSRGTADDKVSALNPNMAAVVVDMLKNAELKEGDYVAVGLTGANPGANLALYSALQTLKLNPVIITSVGAAGYGAGRPGFTWLDMEKELYDKKLISFKSLAASLGGNGDRGGTHKKRNALRAAIAAAGFDSTTAIDTLDMRVNLALRQQMYDKALPAGRKFNAFINVGVGQANVGNQDNARWLRPGVNWKLDREQFEADGMFLRFARQKREAGDRNIPIINIDDMGKIAQKYQLPYFVIEKMPAGSIRLALAQRDLTPGRGGVFTGPYSVPVTIVCLVLLILIITVVIWFDRRHRHFTRNVVDAEEDF